MNGEHLLGKIAVITDSNTCLPPDILKKYRIEIVPIVLIFGDEILRDGVDISVQGFYARLRTADPLPKTSSPGPTDFLQIFKKVMADGAEGAVVITLSSKLSMSYNTALLAAADMPDFPVRVVDSHLGTIAQGFVALAAAKAAASGAGLEAVAKAARERIPDIGFAVMLDTLEYLHKGGRVPAIAALVGSAIRLNPVLGNRPDGTVGIIAPSIGEKSAIQRILNEVERKTEGRHLARLAVMHADALERAEILREKVETRFQCDEIYLVELTPVMGAHAGPGVVGLAYHVEDPSPSDAGEE